MENDVLNCHIKLKHLKNAQSGKFLIENADRHDRESRDEVKRDQWGKQIEFLLSCLGYSVGLSNLCRFPYMCFQNGGGAFLIPYVIYLVICGTSLYLMETALGQSTGISTVRIFDMVPFFQGLGWAMVTVSGFTCMYCGVLLGYALYFLGMSFSWTVPWSHCDNAWNTLQCYTPTNHTVDSSASLNTTMFAHVVRSSAQEFWLYNVLEKSENMSTIDGVNWKMAVAFTGGWILCFLCMCKGIRSSGKVVYVTATVPYILLTVIIVRGCTLSGAWRGIKFYILPDWKRLKDINVWIAAASQIFFSLGPAWGGLVTFASYNKYHNNVLRDGIVIPLISGASSIYAGFAIFSIVGHLAYVTNQDDLENMTLGGFALAFIAYPQALATLPGASIWSVLFFITLITLGIDSQFATLESVTTGIIDRFPETFEKRRVGFTLFICTLMQLLGLFLTTRAGFYYFELLDYYAASFTVLTIGFVETLVIGYIYGARRFLRDMEDMVGPMRKITKLWLTLVWCVLNPIMILAIVVSTCVTHVLHAEDMRKQFPGWAIMIGWIAASLSFMQIPIWAVYATIKHKCNCRKLFSPDDEWRHLLRRRKLMAQLDEHATIAIPEP